MDGQKFDKLVKNLSLATSRRGMLKGSVAALAALGTRSAVAANKVTICHFTGSASHPYNIITISTNALNQHVANHGDFIYTNCCLDSECGALTDQCNVGACNAGTCVAVPQTGVACDDGDFCTTGDTCDATGACVGTKVDCSGSGDACNVGECDPADGSCVTSPANDGGPCADDGDVCTTDTCSGGTCVHSPIDGCCHSNDECADGFVCIDNTCTENPNPECAGETCDTFTPCSSENADCVCTTLFTGGGFCVPGSTSCEGLTRCPNGNECPGDALCTVNTCCQENVCVPIDLACVLGEGFSRAAAPVNTGADTIGGH